MTEQAIDGMNQTYCSIDGIMNETATTTRSIITVGQIIEFSAHSKSIQQIYSFTQKIREDLVHDLVVMKLNLFGHII